MAIGKFICNECGKSDGTHNTACPVFLRDNPNYHSAEQSINYRTIRARADKQSGLCEIELGDGSHIITDIIGFDGDWAGIAISRYVCNVGEVVDTGAQTVDDLNPVLTIKTNNPASLDVLILACQRAKRRLLEDKGLLYDAPT